jgi:hypothetical protein
MMLFLILALLLVVVAVLAATGVFAGPRRTHIIDRTYVSDPVDEVDEVVEEPVRRRRVRRRVVR